MAYCSLMARQLVSQQAFLFSSCQSQLSGFCKRIKCLRKNSEVIFFLLFPLAKLNKTCVDGIKNALEVNFFCYFEAAHVVGENAPLDAF